MLHCHLQYVHHASHLNDYLSHCRRIYNLRKGADHPNQLGNGFAGLPRLPSQLHTEIEILLALRFCVWFDTRANVVRCIRDF